MSERIHVAPSARRLTGSLRDVGYSFESAVADIVDNSITSGAENISVRIVFDGKESFISISDDGLGMSGETLNEAMRFGSRRNYGNSDLGRYGLGLKTASLSQCRRIEVFSKEDGADPEGRALDLDFIEAIDGWYISDISSDWDSVVQVIENQSHGTSVIWKHLDRVLPAKSPTGGWARRRIESLPEKLSQYLSMVFHRFLSGENTRRIEIRVNDTVVKPWDPFARDELNTRELPSDSFEIEHQAGCGVVQLRRFLLPTKSKFSTLEAYEALSGPDKWNRQQGLYVYRANRLVQWGGWAGVRTADEHTKFARAALDFDTDLDEAFNINVAKMRVSIPSELRKMIARPINELCIQADADYRKSEAPSQPTASTPNANPKSDATNETGSSIGLTLRAAAARTGNLSALNQIMEMVRQEMPETAEYLGFD